MLNSIIKEQLGKIKLAQLPEYDENTRTLHIPCGIKDITKSSTYQLNRCYIVELAEYILNPPPDFSLASNWNHGSIPKSKYYYAEILQIMGKMIKITGCGYDINTRSRTNDVWEGWVPQKGLKLIQEVD